jgi:membrane-associated PAP2 superfamily phosphatase
MPLSTYQFKGIVIIIILFAAGVGTTALMDAAGTDLDLAGLFYREGAPHEGWAFSRHFPWGLLYDYGEWPAIILAIGCLVLLVIVRLGKAPRRYARPCLVVILTVIVGPGLIVNGLLKSTCGRPRPVDVREFDGRWDYRRPWERGVPVMGKSFPCGHGSMAYSIASASAFYPYHPAVAVGALVGGIAFGTITGVARMAQGGHFATDVLWSGIIVFILIAVFYYLVFRIPDRAEPGNESKEISPRRHREH